MFEIATHSAAARAYRCAHTARARALRDAFRWLFG